MARTAARVQKLDTFPRRILRLVPRLMESGWGAWVIIGLGVAMRVVPYLINRSLWLDEAYVALIVVNRSLDQILRPSVYDEYGPFGFLPLLKLGITLIGKNEYALRLLPLVSSIVTLPLFYSLALKFLSRNFALLALALFACMNSLIYYASEAKQYSSDVLISTLLLLMAKVIFDSTHVEVTRALGFGVVGAIVLWFSHPAVFVLAGAGITLSLHYLKRREPRSIILISLVAVLWSASFSALYFVLLRHLASLEGLRVYWSFSLAPANLNPAALIRWLVSSFVGIFSDPLNLPLSGLVLFCFAVGACAMFLKNKWALSLLLSPLVFALLGSIFHKYAFSGRLLIFSVPMLLILVALGTEQVVNATRERGALAGIMLTGLLVTFSFSQAIVRLQMPRPREDIKPALAYLRDHLQPGDTIYVHHMARFTLSFYQDAFGINDYVISARWIWDWNALRPDLEKLRGRARVWVLYSTVYRENDANAEEKFLVVSLDELGARLTEYRVAGASIYLYDLSR